MQNFCLTYLTFRLTFAPLTFFVLLDLNLSLIHKSAASLNLRHFNTKIYMTIAPILVSFNFLLAVIVVYNNL